MKKTTAILCIMALVLTACRGQNGTGADKETKAAVQETKAAEQETGEAAAAQNTEAAGQEDTNASQGIVPKDVVIYGGTTGGSWNLFTTVAGNFLPEEIPGIRTTVSPGAALSNLQGVQDGTITLAISKLPTTVDGYNAVPPFAEPLNKVVNMGYLYTEHYHILVNKDSDIYSVADLKGKNVTTFAKGNTAELICSDILSVYGLTYDDLGAINFSSLSDMGEQFKDGLTDCLMFASATPVSTVLDIVTARDIRLIELTDEDFKALKEISPAYIENVIPAGTYNGVEEEVRCLGTMQHLIVSSDLDEGFVYDMTKAIVEHLDDIGDTHAVYAELTPEMMAQDLGIPMHPGAEKYYREIGAMK